MVSETSICKLHTVSLTKVNGYYPEELMVSPESGYIPFLVAHGKKFPNRLPDLFHFKKNKYSGKLRSENYCVECERIYTEEYSKYKTRESKRDVKSGETDLFF